MTVIDIPSHIRAEVIGAGCTFTYCNGTGIRVEWSSDPDVRAMWNGSTWSASRGSTGGRVEGVTTLQGALGAV